MGRVEELFSIRGKTALVTGGGDGIGRMIAAGYVEAGAKVYIASRKLERCEKTAAELSAAGGTCIALGADLSKPDECERLAGEIAAHESELDILVNNAGATWGAPLEEFPDAAWDRVLGLNVKGVFHLTRALVPLLEAAGTPEDPARVINIGSGDGIRVPDYDNYAYSTSKAAVHFMSRVLAKKLAARNISVNLIAPGPFRTRMMAAILDEMHDEIAALAPLRRIGQPDDIAAAAIYLASPGAAWLTGVTLPVDGGITTTL